MLNHDLILIFFLQTCMLSLNCLFLPLQYTKMSNMTSTRKWHIYIYKESTYTCRCICSCIYIAIQIFATCITNTHSSLKYCPMATAMSFPNFMTVKNHCTEHASDISQTFQTKPLIILDFSCHTKYIHCCWMCSHKHWCTWLHLPFCLFHTLLVIFYLLDQMLQFLMTHFDTRYQQLFQIFCFLLHWITLFPAFFFSSVVFCTHSNNLFSICVGISPVCIHTKIWYGQLWHHRICAHSIHIKYICVPYVVCCIFVEIFFTMYVNSHLSLKKIDYSIMFQTDKYVKTVSYL